ncbi:MAG: hypothetical protein ACYDG6_00250 [Thermincolia bacterium]
MQSIKVWRSRYLADEKGSALLLSVIISAVVVMMVATMVMVSTLEFMMAVNSQYKKESRYLAEAAINRAVYEFIPNSPGYGVSRSEYPLGRGKYLVNNISQVGAGVYEVTGRGVVTRGGVEYPHFIKVRLSPTPTGYGIISWQEN